MSGRANRQEKRRSRRVSPRSATPLRASQALPVTERPTPAVVWTGPIFDPSGYASAVRGHACALRANQLRARLEELRWNSLDAKVSAQERQQLEEMLADAIAANEAYVHVWQCFPRYFQVDSQAAANVGRPYFETDRLPPDWVEACNRMDRIWVPSEFSMEAFARSGVPRSKLRTLPDSIDPARFGPDVQPLEIATERSFNFLSICEWIPRKGWDLLVRAFVEEFAEDEDVGLTLQVFSLTGKSIEDIAHDIRRAITAAGKGNVPPIRVNTAFVSEDDVPRLYRSVDAYVLPHRGEGWGRTLMEAMATGLPTIGTRWSAPLEFMSDANSYLVDCDVVDVPQEMLHEQPYYGGHRWAEPSVEHLRAQMRAVFRDRVESQERGRKAALDVAAQLNPMVVGARIRQLIEEAASQAARLPVPNATTTSSPLSSAADPRLAKHAVPVVWEGGFFETHSLALVNRELAGRLLASGRVDLSLRLRELEPPKFDPRTQPAMAPLLARLDRLLEHGPAVHVRHAWPPVFKRPEQGRWVMIQPWEFGRLPLDWIAPMRDDVDESWAYTSAVKRMYVESGVPAEKIHIVPLGIDPRRFRPDAKPLALPTSKRTRFLFVGGTIWRKGIDILLQAYCRAFTPSDDVSLIVKDMGQDSFYKGQGAAEAIARLQADPNAPEIVYATGALEEDAIAGLYTSCTCLVHPYRGEGFGLPVAEAMACGLATIVTQGGSTDDFCDDSRCYLIPSQRREMTLNMLTAGTPWVLEPDLDALVRLMRTVHEDPATAAYKGRNASEWARQHLTWDRAAETALERIRMLAENSLRAQTDFELAEPKHPIGVQTRGHKVSVLIPSYNRPAMLDECLASLHGVTIDAEIVVIDDASAENVDAVVERHKRRDPRIRYLKNERNLGVTANFNRLLSEARGQYLCIMGNDDANLPGNFEKKAALLDAHPKIGLVYSRWYQFDDTGRVLGILQWPGLTDHPYIGGRDEFLDLLPASYLLLHSMLFRRELWEQRGGVDARLTDFGNDWDMVLRFCYQTQTAFINEPLLKVRAHAGSHTQADGLADGRFAPCRIAVWRKWLVENDDPPVLDDMVWRRMFQAFVPDLQNEFKGDEERQRFYLQQLQQLREDHIRKLSLRFARFTDRGPEQLLAIARNVS